MFPLTSFPDQQEFINSKGRIVMSYKKNSYGSYDYHSTEGMSGSDQPPYIMALIANTKDYNPSLHSRTRDFVLYFKRIPGSDWNYPLNDPRVANEHHISKNI
jgi:hypothetical protein